MYAQVIVDIAHSEVDRLFTYAVPGDMVLKPGQHVLVPFGRGNKPIEGFVLGFMEEAPEDMAGRIKPVLRVLEPYPIFTGEQLELARWMQQNYHCVLVDALRLMIPAQLRGGRIGEKTVRTVQLADGVDIEAARASLLKKDGTQKAPRQSEVLELLAKTGAPMSVRDIAAFLPGAEGAVAALIKKGLIAEENCVTFRRPNLQSRESVPVALTAEQNRAVEAVTEGMQRGNGVYLLHGVTGSGKTEVYMHCISRCIAGGKQAILLVPEIALTPQTMGLFRARFGDNVAVMHSRLSAGERFDEWRRIRLGMVQVAVGARSAVFAPFENLGLLIVDEEHEPTYQSELSPRYQAVEVAKKRASMAKAPLILGSATPSIQSYYRAKTGVYTLIELTERVHKRPMPEIKIVDMRQEFLRGNTGIFSGALYNALNECLRAKKQAILFINRRGYSTFVSCRACGYVFQCSDCDISMTYHRTEECVKCHYCGHTEAVPTACPSCGQPFIKYFGVGTQQVEEQLREHFPNVTALRMDLDSTRTKDAHETLLSTFARGEAQVLIGTQMVAKGLDFPEVTLVGVVAADSSLYLPDYRSAERTFQL
ncbi:MAG TPA: primosomal protein N', partial [Feifaniaceae bacterium]|nr:primosomal protein N' [Feifaniaceae bacterium]